MSDSESTVEKTARCAIMARISFSHAIKLTVEKYSRADNPSVCLIQFDGLMFMYLQDSQDRNDWESILSILINY